MRRASRHLQDDRLFDCYVAERAGDTMDPPAAEHLADCGECHARYADLRTFMEALRAEAAQATDEAFTPERLRVQRDQILRRIEHVGQPARVLPFPGQAPSRYMSPARQGLTRWVYAAAAAGLVIGVALGTVYKSEWNVARQTTHVRTTNPAVSTRGIGPAPEAVDDAFLSDLDVALEQPHTRSLQSFEALTPHVRDLR